jgi:hypothetical protein
MNTLGREPRRRRLSGPSRWQDVEGDQCAGFHRVGGQVAVAGVGFLCGLEPILEGAAQAANPFGRALHMQAHGERRFVIGARRRECAEQFLLARAQDVARRRGERVVPGEQRVVHFETAGHRLEAALDRATLLLFPDYLDEARGQQGIDVPVEPGQVLAEALGDLARRAWAGREGLDNAQFQRVGEQAQLVEVAHAVGFEHGKTVRGWRA